MPLCTGTGVALMSGPKSGLTLPAPENAVLLGVRHLHKNHTEQDMALHHKLCDEVGILCYKSIFLFQVVHTNLATLTSPRLQVSEILDLQQFCEV